MSSLTAPRAFRIAVGFVALHVLDDNFFAPQPGTGSATTSSADLCRSPRSRLRPGRTRACAAAAGVQAS